MKIGYARVSTEDQRLTLQLEALKQAGCSKVFREKVSGAYRDRPELNRMIDQLRNGDVVTVWKLDRLARSTRNLLEIVEAISQARRPVSIHLRTLGRYHHPCRQDDHDRLRRHRRVRARPHSGTDRCRESRRTEAGSPVRPAKENE